MTWRIDRKTKLGAGFQYQRNNYEQRDFSGPAGREDIYTVYGSFQRTLSKSVTWVTTYTYVKYDGNVPQLEFQNSIVSTGLQINF